MPTRDGRQMWSSTPRVVTFGKRFRLPDPGLGLDLDRVPAGVPVHAEMAGQRRHGGVVMGERVGRPPPPPARSTPPAAARDRAPSLNVALGHAGSRQRQIRFSQRTKVTRPKQGASCTTCTRRPWPTASTPQPGPAVLDLVGLRPPPPAGPSHPPRRRERCRPQDIEHRIGPGAPARTRTTQGGPPSGLSVRVLGRLRS